MIDSLKLIKVYHSVPSLILFFSLQFSPLSLPILCFLPFLIPLFLFYFPLTFLLKSFEFRLLSIFFLLLFLILISLACSVTDMCSFIFILNPAFALRTLVGLVAAKFVVFLPIRNLYEFATKLTFFWL